MNFKIKEARERVGLSQKELAESLGIKPTTFNGYEKGTHDPKSEVLKEIAVKCKTSVDFLLGLSEQNDVAKGSSSIIDIDRQQLLHNYDKLNSEGKNKLKDYARDLVDSGNYDDTVIVAEVARTMDNSPTLIQREVSEDDLVIFDTAPQSDELL